MCESSTYQPLQDSDTKNGAVNFRAVQTFQSHYALIAEASLTLKMAIRKQLEAAATS